MSNMQVINNPYKPDLLQKLRKILWNISVVVLGVIIGLHSVSAADKRAVLRIAVASNFLLPLKYLKADFEHETGAQIQITSASTAKIYAQILNGAPFDVFLAADSIVPERLLEKKLARPEDIFQYANGQLVLWTARSKYKTDEDLQQAFLTGNFSRIAMANPKTAPYGRAATDVLTHYGVDVNRVKLILGESVGQAFQITGTGNVDMGFVALSQIKAQSENKVLKEATMRYWVCPSTAYRPILQSGIILTENQQPYIAQAFVNYLTSSKVQTLLREKFGYL